MKKVDIELEMKDLGSAIANYVGKSVPINKSDYEGFARAFCDEFPDASVDEIFRYVAKYVKHNYELRTQARKDKMDTFFQRCADASPYR